MTNKPDFYNKTLTILTLFISLIFIGKTFHNLLIGGSDFEPSVMLAKSFWSGNDVFEDKTNNPFYPHLWYIILYPFVDIEPKNADITFYLLNLLFFFGSVFILKKNFNLTSNQTKILIIFSIASTPFTNLIALGNLSLFSLFFLLIFYFHKSVFIKGLALSLCIIKYNMSFLFIIYSIVYKQFRVLCIFLLINILAIFFYFYYLEISDVYKIFDPLILLFDAVDFQEKNGVDGINLGVFNIHNSLIFFKLSNLYYYIFFILVFLVFYKIKTSIKLNEKVLIFLLYASLILIYHMIYDYVLLIPILAYILKNKNKLKFFNFYLFSIFYIFYIYKINAVLQFPIPLEVFSLIGMLLLILSGYLLLLRENSTNSEIS
jgi:hypothetical protein